MNEKNKDRKIIFYDIKELTPYFKYFVSMAITTVFLLSVWIILSLIQIKFSIINQKIINADIAFLNSILLCGLGLAIYMIPILILFIKLPKENNIQNLVDKTIKTKKSLGFYIFVIGFISSLVTGVFYTVNNCVCKSYPILPEGL